MIDTVGYWDWVNVLGIRIKRRVSRVYRWGWRWSMWDRMSWKSCVDKEEWGMRRGDCMGSWVYCVMTCWSIGTGDRTRYQCQWYKRTITTHMDIYSKHISNHLQNHN